MRGRDWKGHEMNESTAWQKLIKLIAEKVANEVSKQPQKKNESNHIRPVQFR